MDLLLNEFLGLLEGELDLYRSLFLVLQKEKEAVVDSKLKELNESSKEKENLLLKIRILEEQRLKLLEKLADFLEFPSQDLTLSKLSQMVEEPYSTQLKDYYANFLALIQNIQDVNKTNKALVMHSMELVRGSLTLFNSLTAFNPVYYRTGKIQTRDQSGRVLSDKI